MNLSRGAICCLSTLIALSAGCAVRRPLRQQADLIVPAADRKSLQTDSMGHPNLERLPPIEPPSAGFVSRPLLLEGLPPMTGETLTSNESLELSARPLSWLERLLSDQGNLYSSRTVLPMGIALITGAALANTGLDQNFRVKYTNNIRDASTDEFFEALHTPKFLGNGWLTLPVYAGASILGRLAPADPAFHKLSHWGDRTWRGILVGAAPLVSLQWITGGSRPDETDHEACWAPFSDNNGVSGHAFMGAVPFLAAASLTDSPWLKAGFFIGSTVTAISRVNDDGHYLSQVLIGWSLAYVAVEAVRATDQAEDTSAVKFTLFPVGDGAAVGFEYVY